LQHITLNLQHGFSHVFLNRKLGCILNSMYYILRFGSLRSLIFLEEEEEEEEVALLKEN